MLFNAVPCHASLMTWQAHRPHQACHSHQVLAFPCDSFHQESGTDQAVKDFARVRFTASCVMDAVTLQSAWIPVLMMQ